MSHEKIAVVGLGYVGLPLATLLQRPGTVVDVSSHFVSTLAALSDITYRAL